MLPYILILLTFMITPVTKMHTDWLAKPADYQSGFLM